MDVHEIRTRTAAMLPELIDELGGLVGHASVAFPGYPSDPVTQMGTATADLMTCAGFSDVRLLEGSGTYPTVYADMPGPPGSPTALLYAHYDVQPAPVEAGWDSDPWVQTERDGRLYGRGAADDKAGLIIHAATMRLFDGRPPVGIRLVVEGMEETSSPLGAFVKANPDLFRADVYVIADMGNLVAGQPVLTSTLRGDVMCFVETRTIDHAVHSGVFGGAAPDALVAVMSILAHLWDEEGRTIVPGLRRYDWTGADFAEDLFRSAAGVLPDVTLPGTGSISSRLWSQPSATVIGLDAPSIAQAANILIPSARAKVGMRIVPGSDPARELDLLMDFLRSKAPPWAEVEVTPVKAAGAFVAPTDGPAVALAKNALRDAYGIEPSEIGAGGTIPLLASLLETSPDAEFLLWGAEDVVANIHGPNESVDPREIERMIVTQTLFLDRLAQRAA